ncbi:MAG: hypothetical protein DMD43_09260 [Gemmatimonadetes bacterium]|nr:MAG: hypothetical protein DMD43_09260 [Gemmatimonadota bacterium]
MTGFGLRHLLERLQAGDRPGSSQTAMAVAQINAAVAEASRKIAVADRAGVAAMGQQVLAMLAQ